MPDSARVDRLRRLATILPRLSDAILARIEAIAEAMALPHSYRPLSTDPFLASTCFVNDFGDTLRLHHCFSKEPFSKDKFEYAMESVARACGQSASLADKGNPGHDLTVNGERFSLKTQADKSLKIDHLHISKFKELGKGAWGDDVADLMGLRDQGIAHMSSYERILTLRYLRGRKATEPCHYELVEIPKALLLMAARSECEFDRDSKQRPRPGYCRVSDAKGLVFEFYFDGGTERKLQVRHIRKSACVVHAEWEFQAAIKPGA